VVQIARQLGLLKMASFLIEKGAVDSGDNEFVVISEEEKKDNKEQRKIDRGLRKLIRHCDYPECDKEVAVEQLKKCSLCEEFWYCSESHQKLHWVAHKPICKKLQF
jgi:hypothetical protein